MADSRSPDLELTSRVSHSLRMLVLVGWVLWSLNFLNTNSSGYEWGSKAELFFTKDDSILSPWLEMIWLLSSIMSCT